MGLGIKGKRVGGGNRCGGGGESRLGRAEGN